MGHFAVHIARQHVVIATIEHNAEIRRRAGIANIHPADVDQMPQLRI
jgi:hypothetical protein